MVLDSTRSPPTLDLLQRAPVDRESLALLLRRHAGFVRASVARQVDRRLAGIEPVDDVVQHVFEAVTRSIAHTHFAHEGAFRSWLTTLVRNRIHDLRRLHFQPGHHPRSAQSLEDTVGAQSDGTEVHLADLVPGPGTSLSARFRREAARTSVALVLARLPEGYATVIRLLRIEGLPTDEVARRLGKQPAAVRKMLSRALMACRAAMDLPPEAQP